MPNDSILFISRTRQSSNVFKCRYEILLLHSYLHGDNSYNRDQDYESALEEMRKGEGSEGSEASIHNKHSDSLHSSDTENNEGSKLSCTASQPSLPSPNEPKEHEDNILVAKGIYRAGANWLPYM